MDGSSTRVLAFCMLLGIVCTSFGGYECVKGHNYSLAARHETSIVGRIVRVLRKGGFAYEFSVDGVKVDDYSDVCNTPLAPDACFNNGPVLVYYSYEPFPNSRLEDFAVASTNAYRLGEPALAVGLPLTLLNLAAILVLQRKHKREDDSEPGASHVVPGE